MKVITNNAKTFKRKQVHYS